MLSKAWGRIGCFGMIKSAGAWQGQPLFTFPAPAKNVACVIVHKGVCRGLTFLLQGECCLSHALGLSVPG